MKKSFTTFDISKALGIPIDRLRQWIDLGFVNPSIQSARGRGTKALFSRRDLYTICLFRDLVDRGFRREPAAVDAFSAFNEDPRSAKHLRYMVFFTSITRKARWTNTRKGRQDKMRKDSQSNMIEWASSKDELANLIKSREWDRFAVIDIEKIKDTVDKSVGG